MKAASFARDGPLLKPAARPSGSSIGLRVEAKALPWGIGKGPSGTSCESGPAKARNPPQAWFQAEKRKTEEWPRADGART